MDEILKNLEALKKDAGKSQIELIEFIQAKCRNIQAKFDRAEGSCLYAEWEDFRKVFEK